MRQKKGKIKLRSQKAGGDLIDAEFYYTLQCRAHMGILATLKNLIGRVLKGLIRLLLSLKEGASRFWARRISRNKL